MKHSPNDHLFQIEGAANLNHPAELKRLLDEAKRYGVKVEFREGGKSLAYQPAPTPGLPGRMVLTPDASISAVLHEVEHMRIDKEAGWPGLRGMMNADYLIKNEFQAYNTEVKRALMYRRPDIARSLCLI
jgi:hypothetical protein